MASAEFTVTVETRVLEDLAARLRNTRWPQDLDNDDWFYGTNLEYLRELVDYWINHYDWAKWQDEINSFRNYRIEVDGIPIHFIREEGYGPNPIPLILTHGWPWTFWDYSQIIRPLADPGSFGGDPVDAFEVIVPSLPGFGFSTPLRASGMNYWRTADLWHVLMTQTLGFQRFAAQGGDYGAVIASQLAHKYPQSLYGIHVTNAVTPGLFSKPRPWDMFSAAVAALPAEDQDIAIAIERHVASHITTHILSSQTLAYGAHDSPVGLLAWLLERRRAWSDCKGDLESRFSKDHLLTTTMIYWVTSSFVSSVRYYADSARYPWRASHNRTPMFEAPAGLSIFAGDGASLGSALPRLNRLANYNIHYLNRRSSGGHFAPAEEPAALIEDIRATFRDLR